MYRSLRLDLAVVMAIISSYKNIPVPDDTLVFGEVGLSGEIRAVRQVEERIREAKKLGFRRVILPRHNAAKCRQEEGIELIGVRYISELFQAPWLIYLDFTGSIQYIVAFFTFLYFFISKDW